MSSKFKSKVPSAFQRFNNIQINMKNCKKMDNFQLPQL